MRKYDSISNCPIAVFDKVLKTGDYSSLNAGNNGHKCWEKIMDGYFSEFGVPANYKRYLKKKIRSTEFYVKAVDTGDKSLETWGDVEKIEAESEINTSGESENISVTCAKLSRRMGFIIDPNKVSVLFYNASLKAIEANG